MHIYYSQRKESKEKPLGEMSELLEAIAELEKRRALLLNTYWTNYFKVEWPDASGAKARVTSPVTQSDANVIMAFSTAIAASLTDGTLNAKNGAPASPQQPRNKRRKMSRAGSMRSDSSSQDDEIPIQPPALPTVIPQDVVVKCYCKKSRCLKLYCDCFASKSLCNGECKCADCENNQAHLKRRDEAMQLVLERRPDAFQTKVFVAASGTAPLATTALSDAVMSKDAAAMPGGTVFAPVPNLSLAHARGCTCRRTNCLKKYCVCYNTNVKCGEWCRCVGCENGKIGGSQDEAVAADDVPVAPTLKHKLLCVLAEAISSTSPVQAQ